jgi:hypothetical protein
VSLREESMIRIVVKFVVGGIGVESFRGAVVPWRSQRQFC